MEHFFFKIYLITKTKKKKNEKYQNTHETPFPNKTKTLFPSKNNIYFANQERNYKILENQTLTKKLMTLFPNF